MNAPHNPNLANALQKASDALGQAAAALRSQAPAVEPSRPGGSTPANLLTSRQLGAIHAIGRRAGLSRDDLAHLVVDVTGKGDLTQLSRAEASQVIDRLNEMAA